MLIYKKPGYCVTLLAAAVFLLQSCATVVKGTSQKIPVTSAPIGARVLVDGKDMGTTPLTLKLGKKKPRVIRIEKEGFDPHEIRITRNRSSALFLTHIGNIVAASAIGGLLGLALVDWDTENETGWQQLFLYPMLGALAVGSVFYSVDGMSGAPYFLSPEALSVVLSPARETARLEITKIDEARLRDIKWLRIRALDKTAHRTD